VVHALGPGRVERLALTEEDEYFPLARPVRQALRELARQGRLFPTLHDAFVNDRTTRADDLLARIEDGGLVGALDSAAAAPRRAIPPVGQPHAAAVDGSGRARSGARDRAGGSTAAGHPVRWAS
jgi:hypothetical protein